MRNVPFDPNPTTSTIAVDIDDTLYSFTGLARGLMADLAVERGDKALERGAYASWDEWRTPVDLLGLEAWLEVIDLSHSPELIVQQAPFVGAVGVCQELLGAGHKIKYISHRASGPVETATLEWLNLWGFTTPEELADGTVQVICTDQPKGPLISDCRYLIDDRPKTIFEFLSDFDYKNRYGSRNMTRERKAFALMAPYNRGMTDVPNLFLAPGESWRVLRQYLIREGVLNADRLAIAA